MSQAHPFLDRLRATGVVAVIRADSAQAALAMCDALVAGGVLGLELTYTTPGCTDAVNEAVKRWGTTAVVGVGSVRHADQVEAAVAAGAQFAVSPHFDPDLIIAAMEAKLPYLPGAITPTEVVQAYDSGATAVKLFPGSLCGPDYLKALKGPLPEIPLMPTGGVSVENMAAWFAAGAVAVGMGGKLASGDAASITAAAKAVTAELARIRAGGAKKG